MPWCKHCHWWTNMTLSTTLDVRDLDKKTENGKMSVPVYGEWELMCKKCGIVLSRGSEKIMTLVFDNPDTLICNCDAKLVCIDWVNGNKIIVKR